MRVRKEWWYVLAIAVLIVFIIFFRDNIGFAPANEKSVYNDFAKQIGFDADVAPTRQQERNARQLLENLKGLKGNE